MCVTRVFYTLRPPSSGQVNENVMDSACFANWMHIMQFAVSLLIISLFISLGPDGPVWFWVLSRPASRPPARASRRCSFIPSFIHFIISIYHLCIIVFSFYNNLSISFWFWGSGLCLGAFRQSFVLARFYKGFWIFPFIYFLLYLLLFHLCSFIILLFIYIGANLLFILFLF